MPNKTMESIVNQLSETMNELNDLSINSSEIVAKYVSNMKPLFARFVDNQMTAEELTEEHRKCIDVGFKVMAEKRLSVRDKILTDNLKNGLNQCFNSLLEMCSQYMSEIIDFLKTEPNFVINSEEFAFKHNDIWSKSLTEFRRKVENIDRNYVLYFEELLIDKIDSFHKPIDTIVKQLRNQLLELWFETSMNDMSVYLNIISDFMPKFFAFLAQFGYRFEDKLCFETFRRIKDKFENSKRSEDLLNGSLRAVVELDDRFNSSRIECFDIANQLQSSQHQIERFAQELDSIIKSNIDLKNQLELNRTELIRTKQLESMVAQTEQKLECVKREVVELNQNTDEQLKTIEDLSRELMDSKLYSEDQMNAKDTEVKALKDDIRELDKKNTKIEEMNRVLKLQLNNFREKTEDQKGVINGLSQGLLQSKSDFDKREFEVKRLLDDNKELRAKTIKMEAKFQTFAQQLGDKQKKFSDFMLRLDGEMVRVSELMQIALVSDLDVKPKPNSKPTKLSKASNETKGVQKLDKNLEKTGAKHSSK